MTQLSFTTPESLENQRTIVQNVFDIMAEMEMEPVDPPTSFVGGLVSALYFDYLAGGTILVECSPELAYAFTAKMMSIELPDSLNEDVADSMGELINMIGGNLMGLIPLQTRISMPTMLDPAQVAVLQESRKRVSQLWFTSAFGICQVSLFESS